MNNRDAIREAVLAYDRAVHAADPSGALDHFTPDAAIEVMGQPPYSAERHVEFLRAFSAAFADQRSAHDDWTIEGDRAATRWTWEGTHVGTFMGAPPTGRRVRFSGLGIITVREGRVARVFGEADLPALLQQLGAAPGE